MSLAEQVAVEEELARRRARDGILGYILATDPSYEANWHHRRICQTINAMQRKWTHRQLLNSWGYTDKQLKVMLETPHHVTGLFAGMTHPDCVDEVISCVMVALPPRHGKSRIVSIAMPAWWFGKDPNTLMISVSYSADLASRLNREVQREIDRPAYIDVFPATRLNSKNIRTVASGNWLRNSDLFEIVGHKGIYRSAGVAGGITGMGFSLGTIDDPLKNRAEADSAVIREGIWEWFGSTLFTRRHKGANLFSIATSWHEDDLNNRLRTLALAERKATQWFCLIYPAILDHDPTPGDPREQGEAMWPSHFPLSELVATRATIGTYEFEALYQQRPAPREACLMASKTTR
jgi:hypothetical protein